MKFIINTNMKNLSITCILAISTTLLGCYTPYQPVNSRNSALTQGNVQMNLTVGVTSKATVIEKFGAPNITTRDGAGREVWTYQRAGQISQAEAASTAWTIILTGNGRAQSGFESSSRMMTLIIKFNEDDIVSDFRSRTSNF